MDTLPVNNPDEELEIQEAVDTLAWVAFKMYEHEHPLPSQDGTLSSVRPDSLSGSEQ